MSQWFFGRGGRRGRRLRGIIAIAGAGRDDLGLLVDAEGRHLNAPAARAILGAHRDKMIARHSCRQPAGIE